MAVCATCSMFRKCDMHSMQDQCWCGCAYSVSEEAAFESASACKASIGSGLWEEATIDVPWLASFMCACLSCSSEITLVIVSLLLHTYATLMHGLLHCRCLECAANCVCSALNCTALRCSSRPSSCITSWLPVTCQHSCTSCSVKSLLMLKHTVQGQDKGPLCARHVSRTLASKERICAKE